MHKILVTGGNGFIGKSLVRALREREYNTTVLSRQKGNEEGVQYLIGDITNREQINNIFQQTKPNTVIHLASLTRGSYEELHKTNVIGTRNILEQHKGRVIFLSSGMVYQGNATPYTEDMLINPKEDYPKTKAEAEKLCLERTNTCILRASMIYGPEQTGTMFIPALKEYLKTKEAAFRMTKGKQKRDFLYIDDLVNLIIHVLEENVNGIFNASSGTNISMKEVIEKARKIVGDFQIENSIPYRENEMWGYILDNTKARVWGWNPKINLEEGLKRTLS
ncbi:NAD(P)-dependent oxidoreductase [Candidatus Woesearchaeota archaeon]|nr:NAD(P)-dependent oxidoreductase [Candidatus Woesearchaeota archaeon]